MVDQNDSLDFEIMFNTLYGTLPGRLYRNSIRYRWLIMLWNWLPISVIDGLIGLCIRRYIDVRTLSVDE